MIRGKLQYMSNRHEGQRVQSGNADVGVEEDLVSTTKMTAGSIEEAWNKNVKLQERSGMGREMPCGTRGRIKYVGRSEEQS